MKTHEVIDKIMEMLPSQPRSFDTSDDPGFWTNGIEILCQTETECEIVSEFIRDLLREFGNVAVHTGYYDPEVDARKKQLDDYTGFFCINFD